MPSDTRIPLVPEAVRPAELGKPSLHAVITAKTRKLDIYVYNMLMSINRIMINQATRTDQSESCDVLLWILHMCV